MGYYSEIAIKLNAAAVDRSNMEIPLALKNTFECVRELEDGGRLYHCDRIKWYGDYTAYRIVEAFLASLDPDKDECYEFLRIGEDDGDVEHRFTTDYETMYVSRCINYDECL